VARTMSLHVLHESLPGQDRFDAILCRKNATVLTHSRKASAAVTVWRSGQRR
jgi:hypothetical protein